MFNYTFEDIKNTNDIYKCAKIMYRPHRGTYSESMSKIQ